MDLFKPLVLVSCLYLALVHVLLPLAIYAQPDCALVEPSPRSISTLDRRAALRNVETPRDIVILHYLLLDQSRVVPFVRTNVVVPVTACAET